jgi:hypothetical protein
MPAIDCDGQALMKPDCILDHVRAQGLLGRQHTRSGFGMRPAVQSSGSGGAVSGCESGEEFFIELNR